MFCSSVFPVPRRRRVGGVLAQARRDTSISSLSLHRLQPTTRTSEASHEPNNGDRRISPSCIHPKSPYELSIRQHAADGPRDATHTHCQWHYLASVLYLTQELLRRRPPPTPSPRGSVLDVALFAPSCSLRRLPLRKSPLREHAPLRIFQFTLLLAALFIALRVDDPLVF